MANLVSLARPYARALFAEARASNALAAWQERLNALAEALSDAAAQIVVRSKVIPRGAKVKALQSALDGEQELTNFAILLVQNDRLGLAGVIANEFAELVRQQQATQAVRLVSAYPLDAPSVKALSERMTELLGTQLEISTEVDPSLIAGIKIVGQGWLIEGNMQAQLAQLSRQLIA